MSDVDSEVVAALQWATLDIEGRAEDIQSLVDRLATNPEWLTGFTEGAARLAASRFRAYNWRWPLYEKYISEGWRGDEIARINKEIAALSDAEILGREMKLFELRRKAKSVGVITKGLQTKIAIADRILALTSDTNSAAELVASSRAELTEKSVRIGPEEMGELLVHRAAAKYFSTRSDIFDPEMAPFIAGFKLSIIDDDGTPQACREIHGLLKPKAFWETHPVPCDRLFCRCILLAITKASAKDDGLI